MDIQQQWETTLPASELALTFRNSVRTQIAMRVLAAMVSRYDPDKEKENDCRIAVEYADRLLAELAKKK